MERVRAGLGVGVLLAAEAAALMLLHRLGAQPFLAVPTGDLDAWLTATPPADAVLTVLRLVALGLAYWLALTTALGLLARLSGIAAVIAAIDWVTLPAVRRLADRVIVVALASTTLAGGTVASAVPAVAHPVPEVQLSERDSGDVVRPELPTPAGAQVVGRAGLGFPALPPAVRFRPPLELAPPAPPAPPATAVLGDQRHEVAEGDNLWELAAAQLAAAQSRDRASLSDREVHGYWVQVLSSNRDRLASGDPDLIQPGEHVVLPPPRP